MTRTAEAGLLAVSVALAGLGTAMVDLAVESALTLRVPLAMAGTAAGFGILHVALRRWLPRANPFLLPPVSLLTMVGIVEVGRIDESLGGAQLRWLLIAAAAAAAATWWLRLVGTATLNRYRWSILLAGLILLALPLLPGSWPVGGVEINGVRMWVRVRLGDLSVAFQPGEPARLAVIIFLASYLAERHHSLRVMSRRIGPLHIPQPRQLIPLAVAAGTSAWILIYLRDLGAAALLFAIFLAMVYVATDRIAYPAAGALALIIGGLAAYGFFDHVHNRVSAWLHPFADYLGGGFQTAQGLFALGSGSLAGSGLGVGRPNLIPAAHSDFIFAAVGEELGYFGAVAVLTAFAVLITAAFGIALRSRNLYRKLLAAGIASSLCIQVLLIVGGIVRLFPLTGLTLPFLSYGGSSLGASILSIALLAAISHEEAR